MQVPQFARHDCSDVVSGVVVGAFVVVGVVVFAGVGAGVSTYHSLWRSLALVVVTASLYLHGTDGVVADV